MVLMRAFSKVDKEGNVKLPDNINQEAGIKEVQIVELKIAGAGRKKNILITLRENAR